MSFSLYLPNSLEEAVQLQQKTGGKYLAGGTVLMVDYYRGSAKPAAVISLQNIPSLDGIRHTEDELLIGAHVTCREFLDDAAAGKKFAALQQACSQLGGPQVRNRATIAGNNAGASPSADTATPLLAYGAEVLTFGSEGERRIPLDEFFLGRFKTVLKPDEIITAIAVPKRRGLVSGFTKVGKRSSLSVSCLNMAAARWLDENGKTVWRIAVGAAAPKPVYCAKASALLTGGAALEEVNAALQTEICPIDDRWGKAAYRRLVAERLLRNYVLGEGALK